MKKTYLIALFLALGLTAVTQPDLKKQERALLSQLSLAKTDSSRIIIFRELANLFYLNNYNREAIPYALQLLDLRKKSKPDWKVAATLTFIGQAYLNINRQDSALIYWEEAILLKEDIRDTTARVDICKNIGLLYFNKNNLAKSKEFYTKGLAFSKNGNRPHDIAICHLHLGRIAERQYNRDDAEQHFQIALQINKQYHFTSDIAVLSLELSELHLYKGDFAPAMDFALQSLAIAESLKNNELIAIDCNQVATILMRNRQFDSAMIYLVRAEKTADTQELQASISGNIGTIYMLKKDLNKAKYYLRKSVSLSEKSGSILNLSPRLNNLGEIMLLEKRYASALSLFQRSLKLSESISDLDVQVLNYTQLGKLYYEMARDSMLVNRPDSLRSLRPSILIKRSIQYLTKSVNLCKRLNKPDVLQENYRLLASAQHELQNDELALKNFEKYVLYRDSVFNIDKLGELNRLMEQYRFDTKKAAIEKQAALDKAAGRTRLRLFVIIGIAALTIALLSFYYITKVRKNRFELRLAKLSQEALNAQIGDHFISNAMDSIQRFIQNNQKEKAAEYLGKFRDLVREVLLNSTKPVIPLEKDLEVLKTYMELEALRFAGKGLQYSIKVDEAVDPECTLVPPMLLQIQVENSIKHGFKKTEGGNLLITIEKKNEDQIICRVEDDGGGRVLPSPGSEAKSTSAGSKLARNIVSSMSRQYSYDIIDLQNSNQQPVGTAVQYTLPYKIKTNNNGTIESSDRGR